MYLYFVSFNEKPILVWWKRDDKNQEKSKYSFFYIHIETSWEVFVWKINMSKFNTSRSANKTFMGNPYKAIKKNASSFELAINFSDIHYYWRYVRNTYMVFQTNTTIIAKYFSVSWKNIDWNFSIQSIHINGSSRILPYASF